MKDTMHQLASCVMVGSCSVLFTSLATIIEHEKLHELASQNSA